MTKHVRNRQNINLRRRRFLQHTCAAGLGSTALFSTLAQLAATAQAASPADDYRALVCLMLFGGNDSFNMIVPTDESSYRDYAQIRSNQALAREALLPIQPMNTAGRPFGLHPGMPEVKALFDGGQLAVVANVGTLVEPVSSRQDLGRGAREPLGLFSHSDQQNQWQTSVPDQRLGLGWGGRIADLLGALNTDPSISMNISMAGTNVFQTGRTSVEYSIDPEVGIPQGIDPVDDDPFWQRLQGITIDSLMAQEYQHLLRRTLGQATTRALDGQERFAAALSAQAEPQTEFSDNPVSQSFRSIARIIGARQALGARRQIFFVGFGGWDHHDELLNNHARMLPVVSRALGEFQASLGELGMSDQVTTFTASEFARTLTSNGNGTDHGWGGNQLVVGGAVDGGRIVGQFPDLYADNPLDVGRGRLIPTLSVDALFAELALWFGVPASDLDRVLPNIARFYDPTSASAPIELFRLT